MKRALLAIFGTLLGLFGLLILAFGGILLALFGTDGRAQIPLGSVDSGNGRAVVINDFQIDAPSPLPSEESWFDLTVHVTGNESLFVGVAPKKETLKYLQGVPYKLIKGIDSSNADTLAALDSVAIPGAGRPEDPVSVNIWEDQGTGEDASVSWPISETDTSLLIMNEDMSPDVTANVEIDASIRGVSGVGIGAAVAGLILVVIAIVLLALAMRSKPSPVADAWPPPAPGDQG